MTKLGAALPKGEANGLGVLASSLMSEPHRVHVVIALVDCKKTTTDHDSGDVEPTARIRRVEVVLRGDHPIAQSMLRRALEQRTGKQVLPYDLEQDLLAAFENIDPHTGEVIDGRDSPPGMS